MLHKKIFVFIACKINVFVFLSVWYGLRRVSRSYEFTQTATATATLICHEKLENNSLCLVIRFFLPSRTVYCRLRSVWFVAAALYTQISTFFYRRGHVRTSLARKVSSRRTQPRVFPRLSSEIKLTFNSQKLFDKK